MSAARTYEDVLLRARRGRRARGGADRREPRGHPRPARRRSAARFIDVGICEQTMIGAAAGLALRGRVPVVHALADVPDDARVRVHPHRRRHRRRCRSSWSATCRASCRRPTARPTRRSRTWRSCAASRACRSSARRTTDELCDGAAGDPRRVAGACVHPLQRRAVARSRTQPFALGQRRGAAAGRRRRPPDLRLAASRGGARRARSLAAEGRAGARLVNLRTLAPVDEAAILDARAGCTRAGDRRGPLPDRRPLLDRGRGAGARPACSAPRAADRARRAAGSSPRCLPDVLDYEGFSAASRRSLGARSRSTAASVRLRQGGPAHA